MATAALQPAFPPPPGKTANLDNPEVYLHTANIAGIVVCSTIATTAFALRCIARHVRRTPWIAEDWMCLLSAFLFLLYVATCSMMAVYGEGYHAWEVTAASYQNILMWLYASSIVWIPAALATKATLLLLTARVFAVHARFARALHLYIWFLAFAYLPVQFVKIFICWPIYRYWIPSADGHCLAQTKVFLTDTAMAFVTDFIIMVAPIPIVWPLRIPLRRKIKIAALMGAGGVAVAVACYREYKIYVFQWTTDVTGDFVVLNLCGTIEITIGLVCACLPAINLMVTQCLEKPSESHRNNRPRTREFINRAKERSTTYFTNRTVPATADKDEREMEFDAGLVDLQLVESEEGRREGWLAQTADQTVPDDGELSIHGVALRRGGNSHTGGILIPDRIWDGKQREESPG